MLKKTKSLLVLVLALIMCLAFIPTAHAEDGDDDETTVLGPATETSEAAITKLLKVPYGTTFPTGGLEFDFEVETISVDGISVVATNFNVPMPPTVGTHEEGSRKGVFTIKFPQAQYAVEVTLVGNTHFYYLESDELFNGVVWSHAGVYEYKITELGCDYELKEYENLTCSKAEYRLLVYVKNAAGGGYEISHIGAVMTVDDDGEDINENDQVKVPPTPGGTGGGDVPYSSVIFTNEFWKTTVTPTDPTPNPDPDIVVDPGTEKDKALYISKKVDGNFADQDMYFRFDVTINVPDLNSIDKEINAYIIEGSKFVSVSDLKLATKNNIQNADSETGGFKITSGVMFTLYLKDSQELVFYNLPVGTNYVVEEYATVGYTPKVSVKQLMPIDKTGVLNTNYSIPNPDVKHYGTDANSYMLLIGETKTNAAEFTNDHGNETPTGLNLDNLPFIGLIVIALSALIAFVLVKSRKSKNYN